MTDPRAMPTNPGATQAPAGASRGTAILAIVLTVVGWASIPLFLKSFTGEIDFWTANGWRYAISALLWLPVLVMGAARRTLPPNLWRAAMIPSLFNALGQMLFGLAPYLIDPGLMIFSLRVQIVFVAIGAAMLFPGERDLLRRPIFILGMALVLGGSMGTVALKPGGIGFDTNARVAWGVLVAVGSGLFYAAYALSVRRYMHGMAAFTSFAAVSQITAGLLVVPMLVFARNHGADPLGLSGSRFGVLVLSAVIGIGLGHTMYFFSIARLGVAVTSGVVQLQPFLVSIGSLFLYDERLTPPQWASGSLAVAGAVVMLAIQHVAHRRDARVPEVLGGDSEEEDQPRA